MVEILIEDHLRRWPADLLVEELNKLTNENTPNWSNLAETLLDDAFEDGSMLDLFNSMDSMAQTYEAQGPWNEVGKNPRSLQVDLLSEVRRLAHKFPESSQLPVLFTVRNSTLPSEGTVPSFDSLVNDLNGALESLRSRGYFEKIFGPDCIDREDDGTSFEVIDERHPGSGLIWPLDIRYYETFGQEYLYNALELFDFYVSAPTERSWHGFGDPHWDFARFARRRGRAVFRWEINRILTRNKSQYEMGTAGDNAGKIIEPTSPEMSALIEQVRIETHDISAEDKVNHAIDLFQKREFGNESKRSACVTLAAVLESRRKLLKNELFTKDEGALFQLANEFHLRHDNERQKGNYDPAFLEWTFWWYLATIDLTNRLIDRHEQGKSNAASQNEDLTPESPF
jgi:hypothetical protein